MAECETAPGPVPAAMKRCDVDGCLRPARTPNGKHCEAHYYRLRRRGTLAVLLDRTIQEACQHCGASLPPMAERLCRSGRFCSLRCEARFRRGIPGRIPCDGCGQAFAPVDGKRTCSPDCDRAKHARISRQGYARRWESDPAFREVVRAAEYRRKARKAAVPHEEFKAAEIYERDAWVCGLCSEAIDQAIRWPHRMSPTLDHIVPLSRGGPHVRSNAQAAHLACNCSKGDRLA